MSNQTSLPAAKRATQSKVSYTPGPWNFGRVPVIQGVRSEPGWFIGHTNGNYPLLDIAQVHLTSSQNEAEQHANAKAIAALPDLIEALQARVQQTLV